MQHNLISHVLMSLLVEDDEVLILLSRADLSWTLAITGNVRGILQQVARIRRSLVLSVHLTCPGYVGWIERLIH